MKKEIKIEIPTNPRSMYTYMTEGQKKALQIVSNGAFGQSTVNIHRLLGLEFMNLIQRNNDGEPYNLTEMGMQVAALHEIESRRKR